MNIVRLSWLPEFPPPCVPPSPPLFPSRWLESFVRGVHLEQLCHTCFHVLLDYRAASPSFEAPPLPSPPSVPSLALALPLSPCNAMHSGN